MLHETRIILMVSVPLFLQMMGLTLAVVSDPYIRRKHRKTMIVIIAVVMSLIAQNVLGFMLDTIGTMPYERTLVGIYGYSVRPLIIVLFYYIICENRKLLSAWILIGINTAIHLTAVFSGICFRIDRNNIFHRGPLGYSCHIVSGVLLVQLFWLTVREYGRFDRTGTAIPIFNALIIVASVVLDTFVDYRKYPTTFLTMAVVSECVFYYIWLHLQFVQEHEQDLEAQQRIQIMMSQIQPHFLYNTLTVIQSLCDIDPDKASDTIDKFAFYLRQNLDSLTRTELVPFEKELKHTQTYADIEMLRFPSIQLEYDIRDRDFSVPALSIQPIVENAIRHGVRIRERGLVSISTWQEEDCHMIRISDNGKGFDVNNFEQDGEKHIGIRNVRERIESMCGGNLEIESRIGEGTMATIRIPNKPARIGK